MQLLRVHKVAISLLTLVGLLSGIAPLGYIPGAQVPTAAAQDDVVFAAQQSDTNEEIVYIDSAGRIQVLDTTVNGEKQIKWNSGADIGFRDIAVGDFQGDGDFEIVGIRGEGSNGELIIYDPVLNTSTIQPDGEIEGVPWAKLYQRKLTGTPTIVGAGNLDAGIKGDEVLFGYDTGSSNSTVIVMNATKPDPEGTEWNDHVTRAFTRSWNHVTVGDVLDGKEDEIVLSDPDNSPKSAIEAYRMDNGGLNRGAPFYCSYSDSRSWITSAIGQVYADANEEVVAVRRTSPQGPPNVFIFRYTGKNDCEKGLAEDEKTDDTPGDALLHYPRPRAVWLANVTGVVDNEADDEVFLLRELEGNSIRLIVHNRGKDKLISDIEQNLDTDNGWKAGAGGDVDGDGRDEIILMRDNKIRIYTDPNANMNLNEFGLSTNKRSLVVADLDHNGFRSGPAFQADKPTIEITEIYAGEKSNTQSVSLNSSKANTPFDLSISPNGSWLTDLVPTSGSTPALITFRVDATNLNPGEYTASIIVNSRDSEVINTPYAIAVTITVLPSRVLVTPSSVAFDYYPCTTAPTTTVPITIDIGGTDGIAYTAALLDLPTIETAQAALAGVMASGHLDVAGALVLEDDVGNAVTVPTVPNLDVVASSADASIWPSGANWLTAVSESATVSDKIALVFDPTKLAADTKFKQAVLLIWLDARTGQPPENIRFVPIVYNCASARLLTPVIYR